MNAQKVPVNRTLAGVLTVLMLVGGALIWVFDSWENPLCAALVRVGLLTGALWLALPTKGREAAWANVSPWIVVGVVAAVLLIARRPQVFLPLAAVVAAIGYWLKPRPKKRPTRGGPDPGPGPDRASAD